MPQLEIATENPLPHESKALSGQFITEREWGDEWEWAFLPSPFSLDAARINQHTLEHG